MRPVIPFKLSPLSSDFKIGVHSQFAKSLQAEVIDGIVNIADKFINNTEASKPKICLLVSNVLEFLCNSSRTLTESDAVLKQQHQNKLFSNVNMYRNPCTVEIQDLKEDSPHARVDPVKADPETTPECMITKVVKRDMSAPTMKPIRKVKARTFPVMPEEGQAQLFSRRLYVQTSGETKVGGTCERNNVVITNEAQTGNFKLRKVPKSNGSMEVPIQVPDMSPNIPMDENHVGVQLVGSTEFRRRQKELSKITAFLKFATNYGFSNCHQPWSPFCVCVIRVQQFYHGLRPSSTLSISVSKYSYFRLLVAPFAAVLTILRARKLYRSLSLSASLSAYALVLLLHQVYVYYVGSWSVLFFVIILSLEDKEACHVVLCTHSSFE